MTSRRTILKQGAVTLLAGVSSVGTITASDQSTQQGRSEDRGLPGERGGSRHNRPDHADRARDTDDEEHEGTDEDREPIDAVGDTLGYYFPAGMDPEQAPIDNLTDLCFHALDIDRDGLPIVRHEHEMSVIAARANDVGTTPHLQIGGMEVDFSPAVDHPEAFAAGVVDIMEEYGYHGIAIDWEYPEQASEFALVMTAVRDALDTVGGGHLGAAVSAVPSIADGVYAVDEVAPIADYFLIMSYDFAGPWSSQTGHNAALRTTSTAPLSVKSAIAYWRAKEVADEQLLAGIPFYGRSFTGVSDENNGYDQPFDTGAAHTHQGVQSMLEDDAFEQFWDDDAGVPHAYSAADEMFLSYESPTSVAAKVSYAREAIGGVGIWAVNQDVHGDLISSVR